LLAAVEAGFARPDEVDVAAVIDELTTKLSHHLDHEERDALPRSARRCPIGSGGASSARSTVWSSRSGT
jgi:hypothetical protein